ncbi:hypothetical protein BGZ94_006269, partial [Podila epigama]
SPESTFVNTADNTDRSPLSSRDRLKGTTLPHSVSYASQNHTFAFQEPVPQPFQGFNLPNNVGNQFLIPASNTINDVEIASSFSSQSPACNAFPENHPPEEKTPSHVKEETASPFNSPVTWYQQFFVWDQPSPPSSRVEPTFTLGDASSRPPTPEALATSGGRPGKDCMDVDSVTSSASIMMLKVDESPGPPTRITTQFTSQEPRTIATTLPIVSSPVFPSSESTMDIAEAGVRDLEYRSKMQEDGESTLLAWSTMNQCQQLEVAQQEALHRRQRY